MLRPVALCHLPVALKHHLIGFCDTVVCTERIVWEPAVGAAADSKIPRCLNIALVRTDDHPTSEQVQDRLFCPLLSQLNGKAVILPQDQSITVDCFMIFWHLELPSAVHPAHFLQQFFLRQREQLFRPGGPERCRSQFVSNAHINFLSFYTLSDWSNSAINLSVIAGDACSSPSSLMMRAWGSLLTVSTMAP